MNRQLMRLGSDILETIDSGASRGDLQAVIEGALMVAYASGKSDATKEVVEKL